MGCNLNFMTHNSNGLSFNRKRIKMFEYYSGKLSNNGILFLQETHSSKDTYDKWRDEFKGDIFFSHGTTKSCGVMIGYHGSKNFIPKKLNVTVMAEYL